jgi:hypothetical protein
LRVDLYPIVALPHRPELTVVLGEDVRVQITQVLQQPRRPFNVREEERDRPGWELGLHTAILSRQGSND